MKIIVALSGGVDSSVAAALLQQQGHEVEAIFMKNWSPEDSQSLTDCPWEQDQADAEAVCAHLGIPFRSVNFEREYYTRVVEYFTREYAAGRTPNPDVMCNKEIKFSAFWEVAKAAGAEKMATGHYAQVEESGGVYRLKRGVDAAKDQSYFLYTLSQEQLAHTVFPLGGYTKPEVRELAQKFGLPTATKKDSQGICFIGHLDLKKFLTEHTPTPYASGEIRLLLPSRPSLEERKEGSKLVGHHTGAGYYTIGERAGALVDNGLYRAVRDRDIPATYIVDKDTSAHVLYVTDEPNDPHLFATKVKVSSWLPDSAIIFEDIIAELTCQCRYQQRPVVGVKNVQKEEGDFWVETASPLFAVSPGQSLVVYHGDLVVCGGVIEEVMH